MRSRSRSGSFKLAPHCLISYATFFGDSEGGSASGSAGLVGEMAAGGTEFGATAGIEMGSESCMRGPPRFSSCRIAGTSMLLSVFENTFRIPDFFASASTCADMCRVHMRMGVSGRNLEISRAAAKPSLPGMARSTTITFGRASRDLATASSPPLASITSQPSIPSRYWRRALRKLRLSSAIRMRCGMEPVQKMLGDAPGHFNYLPIVGCPTKECAFGHGSRNKGNRVVVRKRLVLNQGLSAMSPLSRIGISKRDTNNSCTEATLAEIHRVVGEYSESQALPPGERTNFEGKAIRNHIPLGIPHEEFAAIRDRMHRLDLPHYTVLQEPRKKLQYAYFLNSGMASLVFKTRGERALRSA